MPIDDNMRYNLTDLTLYFMHYRLFHQLHSMCVRGSVESLSGTGPYILVVDLWETAHLLSEIFVYVSPCNTIIFTQTVATQVHLRCDEILQSAAGGLTQVNSAFGSLDGVA